MSDLDAVFAALADPTRRQLIATLATGAATVGELAQHSPLSRPAISQHLAVLERAGLIERVAVAQWRRCSLPPQPLLLARSWLEETAGAG